MDKDALAQQMFGKSYAELAPFDRYRVDQEAKNQPESSARNPQIISGKVITRDAEGNIVAEQVPGLERPINVSIQQTQPVSTTAALTLEEMQAQAEASGATLVNRSGVWLAVHKDGSITKFDPTAFPRADGRVAYNPSWAPAPSTGAARATVGDATANLLSRFGVTGGSSTNQPATPAPRPVGSPPQTELTEGYVPSEGVGAGLIRQPATDAQTLRGEQGTPYMYRVQNGPGSFTDINPDTVRMGLAASGLESTGDFEKDFSTYGQQRAFRTALQGMNPDLSPGRIQSAYFQPAMEERSAMRKERAANLLDRLELTANGENLNYLAPGPEEEDYLDELERGGVPMNAEGGSIQVGANPQSWYDSARNTMRNRPDSIRASGLQRSFNNLEDQGYDITDFGQNYTGQLYNGKPPWMLPAWGGNDGGGYGPGLGSFRRKLSNSPYPGQNMLSRFSREGGGDNMPYGGGYDQPGTIPSRAAQSSHRVGYAPAYANGGQQMLDEPVVGMGMMSNEPKFVAGEAGPEMATFTPVGKPPPRPTAPYPRANKPVALLDPVRVLAAMKKGR